MNDNDDLNNEERIITQIMELVAELGWNVALRDNADLVQGLIIGTEEFINQYVDIVDEKEKETDESLH